MTMLKATSISVLTDPATSQRGFIEIDCAGKVATYKINEDLAHRLCSDLERFLTQVPPRLRLIGSRQ